MNTSELTEAAIESKEQLVANLRRVIADAEELLAATAGQTDSKMADLRARVLAPLAEAALIELGLEDEYITAIAGGLQSQSR